LPFVFLIFLLSFQQLSFSLILYPLPFEPLPLLLLEQISGL
jgi:ABC-type Fe3+ transport system permease subunit